MCRGDRIDHLAPRIDRHQAESLLAVGPADAAADEQLREARDCR